MRRRTCHRPTTITHTHARVTHLVKVDVAGEGALSLLHLELEEEALEEDQLGHIELRLRTRVRPSDGLLV